jgi:hypothetical protein
MKSVIVNDKKIDFTNFDTPDTLIKRIAKEFQTIPIFINNDNNLSNVLEHNNKSITVSFIIDDIKKYNWRNLKSFLEEKKYINISVDEKIKLWIIYNPEFTDLESLKKDIKPYKINFSTIDSKKIELEIKNAIAKNNEEVEKFIKIFRELEEAKTAKSTNFKKEKNTLCFETDNIISIDYLFQKITCNDIIPFACLKKENNEFYKIKNGFDTKNEIDENFLHEKMEDVDLYESKIFGKIESIHKGSYLNFTIFNSIPTSTIKICVYMSYGIKTNDKKIEEETNDILKKIKDFFNFLTIISYNESNISGIFVFPHERINYYLLNDLITLNDVFIYFMTVDERVKTTKQKGGIFTRFFINNEESTCSLICKKFNKIDQEVKLLLKTKDVPYNTDIIRVRINRANNMNMVDKMMIILSKFISIYNNEYKNIAAFYKKYIPDFKIVQEDESIEKSETINILKEEVPELFVNGYNRKCPSSPIIIEEEDVDKYEKNRVMKFPKTQEEGEQYNYVCEPESMLEKYKNNKYIGLRVNTLSNKNKFQWIPCCYSHDQTKSENTGYSKYFSDKKSYKKTAQQNIIKTNKILEEKSFAELPDKLNTFLSFIDPKYNYFREGVKKDAKSFFRCILKALNLKDQSVTSQTKIILDYKGFPVVCQENPNEPIQELKDEFSKNIYMDPRRWVSLFENFYKCKIFIFSRYKNENNVIMETPYHKNIYLKYKKENKELPTIIIYEHWGSDDDILQYPQCELIVKINSENKLSKTETLFSHSTFLALNNFYNEMFKQYYYSYLNKNLKLIQEFYFPDKLFPHLKSQVLDSSGRTRLLITRNGIHIGTNPIPPLPIEVVEFSKLNINEGPSIDEIQTFLEECDIYLISQYININTKDIIELTGIPRYPLENPNPIYFTIKVFDNFVMYQDIPIVSEKLVNNNNDINLFYDLQKIANTLQEFFIYKFSEYISGKIPDFKYIKEFIQNKIVIDSDFEYEIPKSPLIDNVEKIFMKSNLIVLNSGKLLKKLVYGLILSITNNLNLIYTYKNKKELLNFYLNSFDYKNSSSNIVTSSLEILDKINNKIVNQLDTYATEKYFLRITDKNKSFISLVIPTKDLNTAKNISYNYEMEKTIKTDNIPKNVKINVICYIYFSQKKIKVVKLLRKDAKISVCILAYKEESKINFSSLIKI